MSVIFCSVFVESRIYGRDFRTITIHGCCFLQLQRLAGTTAAAAEAAGTSKTTDSRDRAKKSTMSLYIVVPSEAGFTTIYFSRIEPDPLQKNSLFPFSDIKTSPIVTYWL